jgi:predicted  nucleic acid-binding Zn-ribbon protein
MSVEALLREKLAETVARRDAQEKIISDLQQQLLAVKGRDYEKEKALRVAVRKAKEPMTQIARDHTLLVKALGKSR